MFEKFFDCIPKNPKFSPLPPYLQKYPDLWFALLSAPAKIIFITCILKTKDYKKLHTTWRIQIPATEQKPLKQSSHGHFTHVDVFLDFLVRFHYLTASTQILKKKKTTRQRPTHDSLQMQNNCTSTRCKQMSMVTNRNEPLDAQGQIEVAPPVNLNWERKQKSAAKWRLETCRYMLLLFKSFIYIYIN